MTNHQIITASNHNVFTAILRRAEASAAACDRPISEPRVTSRQCKGISEAEARCHFNPSTRVNRLYRKQGNKCSEIGVIRPCFERRHTMLSCAIQIIIKYAARWLRETEELYTTTTVSTRTNQSNWILLDRIYD